MEYDMIDPFDIVKQLKMLDLNSCNMFFVTPDCRDAADFFVNKWCIWNIYKKKRFYKWYKNSYGKWPTEKTLLYYMDNPRLFK